MSKRKNIKTILTEDLFNTNGNSVISDEILNKSIDTEEEIEEENEQNEETEKDTNDETIEEFIEETNDNEDDNEIENDLEIEEDLETKENNIEEKEVNVIKPIIIKNKKIGFNDESYYYEN